MSVFCRRKCPSWLTDFGASHCLGLSGRCAPQGATVCRRAFRKIHLNPGAQSIVSRWQDTSVAHLSQTFTTLLSTRGQKEGKKERKCYRWLPLSHVPVGWRTISSVRHSAHCQRLPVVAPDWKLFSYNSSQQLKTISWVSSKRSESLERLDSGRGRWDDLCCPPTPTPPQHTRTLMLVHRSHMQRR